ncbi:MAG: hypothetical protein WA418_24525 [Bradyrhizobium sp.]
MTRFASSFLAFGLLVSCGDNDLPPVSDPPSWCLIRTYRVDDILRYSVQGSCDADALLDLEIASETQIIITSVIDVRPRVSATGTVVLPSLGSYAARAALVDTVSGDVMACEVHIETGTLP